MKNDLLQFVQKYFEDERLYCGRMLSGNKIAPKGHTCIWNANVISESQGKIWFGDLDITVDNKKLKRIAVELEEPLYVLKEMDARFGTESKPIKELLTKAVWSTNSII